MRQPGRPAGVKPLIRGQAVQLHGGARLTREVDITVKAGIADAKRYFWYHRSRGFGAMEDPEAFVPHIFVLPCRDRDADLRVPVPFGVSEFEEAAMDRARHVTIDGSTVRLIAPNDLIIHEVIESRLRDFQEVLSILKKHPGLDHRHIRCLLEAFEQDLAINLIQQAEPRT